MYDGLGRLSLALVLEDKISSDMTFLRAPRKLSDLSAHHLCVIKKLIYCKYV